jgi:A/G-specific adenine glycosylase
VTVRNLASKGSSRRPAGAEPAPAALPGPAIEALERWFLAHARDLPWRRLRSGYAALVSETMLQQTQVQRVVGAYLAFMERFPTVDALAGAPEQEVLAAWQGLGYYRRARHLHAAAKAIVRDHGGRVPEGAEVLRTLPGVGPYTAGAVSSIVHGHREPIVDGNVHRVLSRLAGCTASATSAEGRLWAWDQAGKVAQGADRPGVANEGMMELGATVCTPASPRCGECPVATWCRARALGTPEAFPAPKPRVERRTVHWHALVAVHEGRVLLEQRGDRGLWARLWQPPTVEGDQRAPREELEQAWGIAVRECAAFDHITSHRTVRFLVCAPAGSEMPRGRDGRWVPLAQVGDYPLANAAWRVLQAGETGVTPPPSASGPRRAPRAARSAATDS